MTEKLSKLIDWGKQTIKHPLAARRIYGSRTAIGLSPSPVHEYWKRGRLGSVFSRLESGSDLCFFPDRPFQILGTLFALACIYGNSELADEVLEQMYGVLYRTDGSLRDEGEKIAAGTRNMVAGYQQWPQLVAKTPVFSRYDDSFLDSNVIGLFLGNSDTPLVDIAWKLNQEKGLRHRGVSLPIGIVAAIAAGLITKEMTADPNTLTKIGMVLSSAFLGWRDGKLVFARLNKEDKKAIGVLFRLLGTTGSAVACGLEQEVFPYLVGGNIGVAAYSLSKRAIDALFMSPGQIYNEGETTALVKKWVGKHDERGEKIEPGYLELLGQRVRHLFAPLLGIRDRQWLLAKEPRDRSQHMPALKEFGVFGARPDVFVTKYCDFYSDETQENLRRLLSSSEGKIISPSDFLLRVAGLEWQRAQLRTELDIVESNFIPAPESLLEFIRQRCVSRLNVLKTLPRSEASLRLALSLPTVFRFLHPEYAEPKIASLAYFRDATYFGEKGVNSGNKGVLYPALRLYWSSLFETIKDNAYLHQFFMEAADLDKKNPRGALAQLRSTFNEIITQQLVPEALACGLTFALDLDPDLEPSGMIKEQLKALAQTKLEGTEDKSAFQENLILYTSSLSMLSFYEKVLDVYQSYYISGADKNGAEIEKIFEKAKANMRNIQKEIIKTITNYFLVTNPALLVRKIDEGEIEPSKEFTYFIYMLALENPEWLKEAALEIERLYKASAQMETGELKSIHSIYALYFINGFTSADSGSSSAQNRYGLPADKLKKVNQAVNSHLSDLAADIISSNLGSGASAIPVEKITDDYLRECNSAVQVCAGVAIKENMIKILREASENLQSIIGSPDSYAGEEYLIKTAKTLSRTSQRLVQICRRRFAGDSELENVSDKLQEKIKECNDTLVAAQIRLGTQAYAVGVV